MGVGGNHQHIAGRNAKLFAYSLPYQFHHHFVDRKGVGGVYEALVRVIADNTISLIANITSTLADMRFAILQINSLERADNTIIIDLKVGCKNIDHYNSIVSRLSSLKDIKNVSRGFS